MSDEQKPEQPQDRQQVAPVVPTSRMTLEITFVVQGDRFANFTKAVDFPAVPFNGDRIWVLGIDDYLVTELWYEVSDNTVLIRCVDRRDDPPEESWLANLIEAGFVRDAIV